jgi:anti-sigma B factor antagonist
MVTGHTPDPPTFAQLNSSISTEESLMGRLPQAFAVDQGAPGGAPGVTVRGEVDVAAVPELMAALDAAIRESTGAFVIDLCEVEFLDSAGLSVLLRARALLGREERELAVVCPPGPVRRLFEVVGIADLLILFRSRAEAAAALIPAE